MSAPILDRGAFQIMESCEADFEKMTWTFTLPPNGRVSAGHFAIIPSEAFMDLSTNLAHAEGLLKEWLHGHLDDTFKERVESHFDPKPL